MVPDSRKVFLPILFLAVALIAFHSFAKRHPTAEETSGLFNAFRAPVVDVIYLATPSLTPFSRETEAIYSSLRLEDGGFKYLTLAFLYVLVSSTFLFLLAAHFLKKKRLT